MGLACPWCPRLPNARPPPASRAAAPKIWALGVSLYECCMQRHPFDADNQGALILKILRWAAGRAGVRGGFVINRGGSFRPCAGTKPVHGSTACPCEPLLSPEPPRFPFALLHPPTSSQGQVPACGWAVQPGAAGHHQRLPHAGGWHGGLGPRFAQTPTRALTPRARFQTLRPAAAARAWFSSRLNTSGASFSCPPFCGAPGRPQAPGHAHDPGAASGAGACQCARHPAARRHAAAA
jgi:hypothetical protein